MRIVFMGTPDFASGILEAAAAAGHEIAGVVTQPDKPVGRKMVLTPSAVKSVALSHGWKVYQPEKVRNNPEFLKELEALRPDVIVVAAYGKIIPSEILHLPKYGCLNVHASLLPKYRGAAPIQWAVIDGEEKSGVTIMQMNEGLDTGDMIAKTEVTLSPEETGGSLFDRLAKAGAELLVETLPKVEAGEIHPVKQPAESPTPYARMIRKEDGHIDWSKPAAELERLVRGLNPWPCTFTTLDEKTLKIWKSRIFNANEEKAPTAEHEDAECKDAIPGTILDAGDAGILVKTGDGLLLIEELQLAGKKRMNAADFLRGHDLAKGTVLG